MMSALIVGTLLALGALAYVLHPLFFDVRPAPPPLAPRTPEPAGDAPVAALREIEFDRATGKLSETDYAALKTRYTAEALAAMRAEERAGGAAGEVADDPVEAAVRAYRAAHPRCPGCGPRPERDAVFCSSCGRFLPGSCVGCGAAVTEPGARFCPSCGRALAA